METTGAKYTQEASEPSPQTGSILDQKKRAKEKKEKGVGEKGVGEDIA